MQHLRIQNKIKELRLLHGYSQKELGKLVGATKWAISLLERHKMNPSEKLAGEFSREFNLPVNKIFYI